MECDRCRKETESADLYCVGCGGVAHGPCDDAEGLVLGEDGEPVLSACDECWAILSHVEHVISCAGGCTCIADYGEAIMAAQDPA